MVFYFDKAFILLWRQNSPFSSLTENHKIKLVSQKKTFVIESFYLITSQIFKYQNYYRMKNNPKGI